MLLPVLENQDKALNLQNRAGSSGEQAGAKKDRGDRVGRVGRGRQVRECAQDQVPTSMALFDLKWDFRGNATF